MGDPGARDVPDPASRRARTPDGARRNTKMAEANGPGRYETLMEVMRERRSIRRFQPRPVPRALALKALEAARCASSGANIQPWEFLLIDEERGVRHIAEILTRERKYIVARDPRFPPLGRAFHKDVPLYILILGDTRLKGAFPQTTDLVVDITLYASLAMATCQLHLAIEALGLGTYFHTPEEPTERELKAWLGIPAPMTIFSIAPVGFPRVRRTSARRPLEEMVHWNAYDLARYRSDAEVTALLRRRVIAIAMSGRWPQAMEEVAAASGRGRPSR